MKKFLLIVLVIFFAYYTAYITSGTHEKRPIFTLGSSPLFYKVLCLISGETDTTSAGELYDRALSYFQHQNYALAIADYKKIIAIDSFYYSAYYNLANTYLANGDTSLAIATLSNFVPNADYPDNVYAQLGLIYQKKGLTDSTKYYYAKAIEINRGNSMVYYQMANLYFTDSIFDKALEYINQSISISESELEYRNLRRRIYLKLDRILEADAEYQYIVTVNPSYFGKYEEYAKEANEKGDYKSAIEYYKLALIYKPNDRFFLESRAWAYRQISELDSSYMDYLLVSKLEPDYLSYFNLAYILDIQNKIKESIENYSKSIDFKGDYHISYNNRGYEYFRLKKYKEAEKDYTKSISLKDDYYLSKYNRALLYAAQNKHDKAIADYKKALELEKSADIHYDLALSYDKLKKNEGTISSFNEYLKIADGTDSVRVNYAKQRIEILDNQ